MRTTLVVLTIVLSGCTSVSRYTWVAGNLSGWEETEHYCWVKPERVEAYSYVQKQYCQDEAAQPSIDACIQASPSAYRTKTLKSNFLACMSNKGWARGWFENVTI
jgi:hypothetical protein